MGTMQSAAADHVWSSWAACCCTAAGQAVLPEIQATLARPSREQSTAPTMMKAGCGCLGGAQSLQFGGLCKLLLIKSDLETTWLRGAPCIDKVLCKCVVTHRNVVPPPPLPAGHMDFVCRGNHRVLRHCHLWIRGLRCHRQLRWVVRGWLAGLHGKQRRQAVGCAGGRCRVWQACHHL